MDNKKYLPLKMIHLAIMIIGIVLYVFSIFQIKNDVFSDATTKTIIYIQSIAALCALISGFLYMANGYKKNAVAYYKGYSWILLAAEGLAATRAISFAPSYIAKLAWILAIILFTILATGKDLGKTKSFSIAGLLLVIECGLFIYSTVSVISFVSVETIAYIIDPIEHIILTITTAFMVCGKYLDKESRGAK